MSTTSRPGKNSKAAESTGDATRTQAVDKVPSSGKSAGGRSEKAMSNAGDKAAQNAKSAAGDSAAQKAKSAAGDNASQTSGRKRAAG